VIRQPVESSSVRSVGYDTINRTLELEYTSGAVYRYQDVPFTVVDRLGTAASIGRYVARNIRGCYRYRRTG
jgi:hypothetical protein